MPRLGSWICWPLATTLGTAISSLHFRENPLDGPGVAGWWIPWLGLVGIAVSATGPALLALPRARPHPRKRLGDYLWGLLGLPWWVSGLPLAFFGDRRIAAGAEEVYAFGLMVSLGLANVLVAGLVWSCWIARPEVPEDRERVAPLSHRLGLLLAVCWPIQLGFGLLALAQRM